MLQMTIFMDLLVWKLMEKQKAVQTDPNCDVAASMPRECRIKQYAKAPKWQIDILAKVLIRLTFELMLMSVL